MGDRGEDPTVAAVTPTPVPGAIGGGTPWLANFMVMVGNYELVPPTGDPNVTQSKVAHDKVISLLGGGEPSDASKLLYAGCQNPDLAQHHVEVENVSERQQFIGLLQKKPDINGLKKKEPNDPDPPTLEFLLGKEGAEAYKKACLEENQSRAFRDAVFLSATKTYPGKKWDNRVVIWVGGPSASGKSYATDDLIEQIIEEKAENNKNKTESQGKVEAESGGNENHFVSIDGGVERQVSQMRQLVLQIALAKGYTGIENLTDYDEAIKTKKHVKKAVLKSQNNLNMVIPATFTDFTAPLKSMAEDLEKQGAEQIYAQVREAPIKNGLDTFKETVALMGTQRAFGAVEMNRADIKPNNRQIKVESKAYKQKHFDRGVSKSDARREFFGKTIESSSYYEITFDLIFAKIENGHLAQLPNQLPLPEGALKTNSRVFAAYNKYVDVTPDLEPGDFTKKVWVKKTGEWKNSINISQPNPADKDEYMVVSLAAVKVARALDLPDLDFKDEWEKGVVKGEEFNIKNFKSSIHKGDNPKRKSQRKASEAIAPPPLPPDLLKEIREVRSSPPPLLKQQPSPSGPGSFISARQPLSSPVIEVAEPNQTLETIINRAGEVGSGLNIRILPPTQAPVANAPITSLKFESNVSPAATPTSHRPVKYEAELKKNTNTVVYKMEPGDVGANAFVQTKEMNEMYALLVNVAFEAHFKNPATKDKQFIITVLPNLGKVREKAFIEAIKDKAEKEGLKPSQIKLLVPAIIGTKEEPIKRLAPNNQAMRR